MRIARTNPITGKENIMDLDVTEDQITKWQQGTLIQNIMPNLKPEEREFLITGFSPEEQTYFNEEE